MAKSVNRPNRIDTFNFVPSIFIIAFLLVGFVPNLDAVDKIAPQWLYLSILNFCCGLFLLFNRRQFQDQLTSVLSSWMGITYLLFVTWAAFSYFYAINPTEVIVNIVRQLNTLFMFLHFGIFIYKLKDRKRLLSLIIMGILAIEVYAVLDQALGLYKAGEEIYPDYLKGVTANRNITAFSIAIKIPFVLYLLLFSNKIYKKIFYSFLIFLSLFSISMIQSRASYIAVFLIGVLIVLYSAFNYYKTKSIKELSINLFYIIPFFLAILFNQMLMSDDKGVSAINRAATIGDGIADNSINQRFRYYQDVFTQIGETPVFGVGLGNWKLKSIYHDRLDINGYVVPYHAHSDFIQLGAELGIFGFIFYLGIFLTAIYFAYFLVFKSELNYDNKWFITALIAALGVYFIDANLNFPIARPQVLAPWALIMSLISFYYFKNKRKEKPHFFSNLKSLRYFPVLTLVLMIFSISITYKTFLSHKGQLTLLRDFNTNKFSIPLDEVKSITPSIPNITVTTIPMNSIKARYFINLKKYDQALELLNKGDANPYLFYTENQKAQVFLNMGKIDSAFVNAKKAFYGLPKNALHASTYAQILGIKKDSKELLKAFEVISDKSGPIIWKNFLVILSQILPSKDPNFIKYASKGVELFPDDKEFFSMKKLAVIGQDKVNEATTISQIGLNYFNEKKYIEAALEFEKAAIIDKLEYAHFENAASAFFMAGDYDKAMIYNDRVINELNPETGKSEYIKSLVLFNYGDVNKACEFLKKSVDYGYSQAKSTYNQRCK